MSTEISVIVPSYNTANYISDAVLSIYQDLPHSEIIVVDDASTDNTIQTLDRLRLKNLKVVQLEKNTPGGAGYPSNVGISEASGEYLAFVDSDDFFYPGYLSEMLKKIKRSECDLCVADYRRVDSVTHSERPSYDHTTWLGLVRKNPTGELTRDQFFTLSPEPWRKVYKASLFENEKVRFPTNGWFNEDYPFHWFVGLHSAKGICYVNNSDYFHRVNRAGQTTAYLDKRIFFLFDHTQSIVDFIQSDHRYSGYDGLLLNWLMIGSWKLARLNEDPQVYFFKFRELVLSFDDVAVKQFQRVALPKHKYLYQQLARTDQLADFIDALSPGEKNAAR